MAAHTNRPACSVEYLHSSKSSNSKTFSLLSLYVLFTSSCHSLPSVNALAAANCAGKNIPLSILLLKRNTSSILSFDPHNMPTLHPAMLCDLLNELSSITQSFAPSMLNKLTGLSLRIKLYGLSWMTSIFFFFAHFTSFSNISADGKCPVGIWG